MGTSRLPGAAYSTLASPAPLPSQSEDSHQSSNLSLSKHRSAEVGCVPHQAQPERESQDTREDEVATSVGLHLTLLTHLPPPGAQGEDKQVEAKSAQGRPGGPCLRTSKPGECKGPDPGWVTAGLGVWLHSEGQ